MINLTYSKIALKHTVFLAIMNSKRYSESFVVKIKHGIIYAEFRKRKFVKVLSWQVKFFTKL